MEPLIIKMFNTIFVFIAAMMSILVLVMLQVELLAIRSMMRLFLDVMRLIFKEEAFVVMIFVVPPTGLILDLVVTVGLATVVQASVSVMHSLLMVAELVGQLDVSFMLKLGMLLLIFHFECAAQVFLKLLLLGVEAIVGLQVGEGLMELTHKDLIVGFAEVCVIIPAELIVAIDHVPDSAHHPLN